MQATDQQLETAGNALGDLLIQQGRTIATAESCTGGWVAKVLTDRAGSSAYVMAGLVTYSNEAKQAILGVEEKVLAEHGAVSEPVVRQMVAGAVRATGVDVAVAISGVAGPGGGSDVAYNGGSRGPESARKEPLRGAEARAAARAAREAAARQGGQPPLR